MKFGLHGPELKSIAVCWPQLDQEHWNYDHFSHAGLPFYWLLDSIPKEFSELLDRIN